MSNQSTTLLDAIKALQESIVQLGDIFTQAAKTLAQFEESEAALPVTEEAPVEDNKDITGWPLAVKYIAASPEDIKLRALQIVNEFNTSYIDKKILDFGCGNASVSDELSHYTEHVTSYDILKLPGHTSREILTDMKEVQRKAPFDIIFVHDVLDHLVKDDPVVVMKQLHQLLSDDGKILLTVHPWTSRHGGHIYQQDNRAYLHLYHTASELTDQHIEMMPNLKVNKPLATYERWIKQAGFIVEDKRLVNQELEPFFTGEVLDRIIANTWGNIDVNQAIKILAIQNIHYVLVK